MDKFRVIIADDHPIFRKGLVELVQELAFIEILDVLSDGMQAYQSILKNRPDIAILDFEMPILSGLEVCKKVQAEKSQTRCVILTMHKERHVYEAALQAGVKGYVLKDEAVQEIVDCLKSIIQGKHYVSADLETKLKGSQASKSDALLEVLSSTELIVLKLVSQEKTTTEIAQLLFVSPNTVENHRANIVKKLQLKGSNALLKFALSHKSELG